MLITRQPALRKFWYAVMPAAMLAADRPQAFTLLGEKIVLWRDADGVPAVAQDRCCHRTAQLSKGYVENGNIVCGYHGWQYDCSGTCVKIPQFTNEKIPPGARVMAYRIAERYGYLWVALDEPLAPIPELAEDGDPAYRRIDQFYEEWNCGALRFIENTFDFAHQAYVHKAMHGLNDRPQPPLGKVTRHEHGLVMHITQPVRNPDAGKAHIGIASDETVRTVVMDWYMPCARRMHITYPTGLVQSIISAATPIDDTRTMVVQWSYRNDTEEQVPAATINAFDRKILDEDKDILAFVDDDLPLDTRMNLEQHMASDQPGIFIRRALMEVLARHGEQEVMRTATLQDARRAAA
ncbi:aromatic ring-hydroxylating dioxygenase subunit alpha [Uliginosibacterium sp. H1]|uniref:aromatic ring-hydroxylating dioxygenase subunit alpha n=1 Tax=Uliginosibacterium sp. H1 TaxID=3114757 RepID=UPI002E18DF50|nr:aromatic ring-hydroxylating dioxygenase subunit alpha [Uliginosibacterium sp. H1]